MATQKQLDANRRNAQKSTGPRTEKGKLQSRMNSLQHGLGAVHILLPHEDPAEFHEVRAGLIETYAPANTQELLLVDAIATAWLRTQRVARFEVSMMDSQLKTLKYKFGKSQRPRPEPADDDEGITIAMGDPKNELAWTLLARYEQRAQSAYYRAIEQLRKVQNERLSRPVKELRAETAHQQYLKRTVAKPGWQPPVPASPAESTQMGSFGRNPEPTVIPFRT
jgi:hypothetical protein